MLTDLSGSQPRQIAASPQPQNFFFAPQPKVEGDYVAWSQLIPGSTPQSTQFAEALSYRIATGTTQVLTQGHNPEPVAISQGMLYYAGDDSGPSGVDLFTQPVDHPSDPVQLTTSSQVAYPAAGGGVAIWQEPVQGEPQSLFVLKPGSPGRKPIRVAGSSNGNAVTNGTDALWVTSSDALSLALIANPTNPLIFAADDLYVSARWSMSGSIVGWGTQPTSGDKRPITLHVARILG